MQEQFVVAVLFAAAAVTAFIAAVRDDWFPKVQKIALAVGFAATAFLIEVTDFLKG